MKNTLLQAHSNPLQVEETGPIHGESKEIEHEIECLRCHDMMTFSSSDSDRLSYFCEECSFLLYLS
jgi:hypothetical protein